MTEMKEFDTRIVEALAVRCFEDFCHIGTQFCSITARRCEYCNAHHHSCFTNLQEKNCTQYCMDQWIQNYEFQKAKEKEENDLYRTLFFILLAIDMIIILVIMVYACNIRFRAFVNTVIDSLRSSSGQPSTVLNGHVSHNSLALAIHPNPSSQPDISPRSISQNNVPDSNRQDGDGLSLSERPERNSRERRVGNIVAQLPAQCPSPVTQRVPATPVQQLTKSKSRTASSASAFRRGEEAALLLTTFSSEQTLSNNTTDSVTYAKQLNNVGDHSQRNNIYNPLVASNSFRPLNYVLSNDTGYNTDACS